MSLGSKLKKLFFPTSEQEIKSNTTDPSAFSVTTPTKIDSFNPTIPLPTQPLILTPYIYEDVKNIADELIKLGQVTLTINKMKNNQEATRLIDFLAGITYINRGDIVELSPGTFKIRIIKDAK